MTILFSIRVSEIPPFTVCRGRSHVRISLRKDAPPQEVHSDVKNTPKQRSAVKPEAAAFNLLLCRQWQQLEEAPGPSSPSFPDSRGNLDGTLALERHESKGASGALLITNCVLMGFKEVGTLCRM